MAEVLIVDDDPDIRAILAFTMEDAGYTVREAGDELVDARRLVVHGDSLLYGRAQPPVVPTLSRACAAIRSRYQ